MTTQHQAAFYRERGRIEVAATPTEPPGPGEVRLEVHYTGICGTDLHIFHGDMDERVPTPAILGHEMSGRIAETGPDVPGEWSTGQSVTVMPLRWCGTCPACRSGHQHVCQRLVFVGIDSPGALQETWNVPAEILVRLPEELPLRVAALIEPTAVAVHDVRRASLVADESVLVVGAGPVGLLVAAVARHAGGRVLVVEVDPYRLSIARGMGFEALDPAEVDVPGHVQAWTDGAGVAAAFDVAGAQAGLDLAVDTLAVRGRLVVVAIHPRPKPLNLHRFFWRELTLIGARVYERADYERAVELLGTGALPIERLVSRVVPLRDAAEAFALLESGRGVTKVLVDCRAEPTP